MKIIEILIDPNGQTKVETKGFSGAECRQASRFIETALGEQSGEHLKPEFYSVASVQQSTQCDNNR